jgi:RNA polymerase sigma-70 factor (ECF subfamily)
VIVIETSAQTSAGPTLAEVYTQIRPVLGRFLAARTGDRDEAEDVLQELWLRVSDLSGEGIANPSGYLHRMANNLVLDRERERQRRRRRDGDWTQSMVTRTADGALDDRPGPDRQAEDRQRLQRLAAAIEALPAGARRVFRRLRVDGLSHGEVASEFGISRSAVEKHVAAAMRHLIAALKDGEA